MRMNRLAVLSVAGLLASCATASPPIPEPTGNCDASKGQFAVNQSYTVELAASVQESTGSRAMRVTRPGQAVTLAFPQDRVNVELDENDKIVRVKCGSRGEGDRHHPRQSVRQRPNKGNATRRNN